MRFLYLIVILLTAHILAAQTKAQLDSLEQLAKISKDTSKVKVLSQLSAAYLYSDADKALTYGKQALTLAEQLHFDKGIANSNNTLGNYYYQTGNYKMALQYQQASLKVRKSMNDEFGMAKSYVNLANAYYGLGNMKEAINNYYLSLKYSEKIKNINLTTMAYTNLANVFYDLKNFKEALKLTLKTIGIREKSNDLNGLAFSYNNAGVMYRDLTNYPLALQYLKKGFDASTASNNQTMLAYSLSNMGDIYNRQGKTGPALDAQKKALAIQQQMNDQLAIAGTLSNIAVIYFTLGQFQDAQQYYSQMEHIGIEIKNNRTLIEAYAGLAKVAEAKKDFKAALQFHKKEVVHKDSLLNEDNTKQIAELQTKYETEKKEQQISLLNKENMIQKLTISRNNTTIGIASFTIIAALAFGGLFYNRYKLKQEGRLQKEIIKQQDLSTKAVLEAEENERRRISGELHDGVGQMFSTVRMNLSGIEDQIDFRDEASRNNFVKTLSLVDESCREVRSISHQMAPNVLLKSGLVSAVRDFITKVDERQLKINLDVQGLHERLNSNIEMVLYRVIQETVNNVIKHAKASRLDIQLVKDPDGLSAMIEDNGVGFDPRKVNETEGLGLKNIESRISYLKGTVDFDSSEGNGTVVSIWIPNA